MTEQRPTHLVRVEAVVRGRVQGVGFRWWTQSQAEELGLSGYARNLADGGVEVVAEGSRVDVERLLERLEGRVRDRPGLVTAVDARWDVAPEGIRGFETR